MAKKTVAAKKRNVKVDANGQARLFLGLLPEKWDSEVPRRTRLMPHRWPHKIVPRLLTIWA